MFKRRPAADEESVRLVHRPHVRAALARAGSPQSREPGRRLRRPPRSLRSWTMSIFWDALDNRERAVLIWTVAIVLFVVWKRDVRSSAAGVLRALVARPLLAFLLGAMLYVASIILLGAFVGVWTFPLLGVTVLWCFGPGAVMFFNSNEAPRDPNYFRQVLRGSLTWVLIVEFLANLYVFNLVVELILIPIVTMLVLTGYVAGARDDFAPAKRLLDVLLTAFGLVLLARAVTELALDFDSFATLENLMRLVLPAALTIAFLPYACFLRACIRRERRCFDRRWRKSLAPGQFGRSRCARQLCASERQS